MTTMKTTKTTNQERAIAAFTNRVQASRQLLARISQHLEDHLGVEPEKVNWAHVGDAARIQMLLEQICDGARVDTAGIDRISPEEK
jgi:hypothetical protein